MTIFSLWMHVCACVRISGLAGIGRSLRSFHYLGLKSRWAGALLTAKACSLGTTSVCGVCCLRSRAYGEHGDIRIVCNSQCVLFATLTTSQQMDKTRNNCCWGSGHTSFEKVLWKCGAKYNSFVMNANFSADSKSCLEFCSMTLFLYYKSFS